MCGDLEHTGLQATGLVTGELGTQTLPPPNVLCESGPTVIKRLCKASVRPGHCQGWWGEGCGCWHAGSWDPEGSLHRCSGCRSLEKQPPPVFKWWSREQQTHH